MTRPEGCGRLDSFPTSPWTRFWENGPAPPARSGPPPRMTLRLGPAPAAAAAHLTAARPVRQPSVVSAVTPGSLDIPAVSIDDLLCDVAGHIVVVVERRAERAATVGQ